MATGRIVLALGMLATVWLGSSMPCDAKVRVFLLGGQSNMSGHGNANELTGPLAVYGAPQKNVKIWRSYQAPSGDCETSTDWTALAPEFGDFYVVRAKYPKRVPSFGPEVSFGKAMAKEYPDDDIYLIKHAWGASSLGGGWNSVLGKKTGVMKGGKGTPGLQYNLFTAAARAALANLDKAKVDYEVAGMLWMQGETDSMNRYGGKDADYEANLTAFIAQMRKDYGKDLAFVIARITTHHAGGESKTRAAQVSVAESTKGVYWFDTDNLPRSGNGHYTTKGQIILGNRFAEEFIKAEKSKVGTSKTGKRITFQRPE